MKILIAEDVPSTQRVLREALQRRGHEVVMTRDGAEALSVLEQSDLNLVIADWLMPTMDGVELCRHVRAREWGRYVYVIMLTILGEKHNIAEAMEAGADDYATKPFDEDELSARLKAAERVLTLERNLAERVAELEEHVRTIRQLKELLPICMYCNKIRGEGDQWQRVEVYIHKETGSDFSHTICPECYAEVVRPELDALAREKKTTP